MRQHRVEVLLGHIGEVVEHHRRVGRHRPDLRALVVEHPQRVDLGAPAGLLVEVELKQELLQQFPILRAAAVVAQRGDLQPEPVQAQRAEPGVGDGDHLGVQRGVVDADRLDADLLQLAVAAGLRPLVAEERARVTQLDRQRAAVQAVFDHRAHHPGGALRPQRHRAVAAVGEGVHLLGHHVGGFADAAGEQRGVLEDGQLDVAVAGPPGGVEQAVAHRDELRRIRRDVVRDALGRRERGETSLTGSGLRGTGWSAVRRRWWWSCRARAVPRCRRRAPRACRRSRSAGRGRCHRTGRCGRPSARTACRR